MAKFKTKMLIFFIVFGSILLTGCALSQKDDISQLDHSDVKVYASSFTMTDILKENILTNLPHVMGNACYYQSIEWDANSQKSLRHFYKFDMANKISEPLVIDSQESGSTLLALAASDQDIYYIKKTEENGEIYLCLEKWNGTGFVHKQRLENVFAESYDILNFLNGLIIDGELLYLLEADGNVYVFHTDGSFRQNYKLPDAQQYALVTDGSNNVFGICVDSGKTKIYKLENQIEDAIYEFSIESNESPIAIESSLGGGLIWWNEEGIHFLNLTEKTSEQVVQWNNEHVNIEWSSVQKVIQISGQQYIILLSYSNDDYVDIARVYQVDESLLPDKKVLTFGMPDNEWGYYDSYISSFNKINKEYQIVIKTYSNEKESGISALQKEILTGMAPDIIDLSLLSIPELCEKNILEDLAPYFDNSAEICKEDVPGFIWESWLTEGKVCAVYPDFNIIANATWDESQRWMDGYSMEQVLEWSQDNEEINILEDMGIRSLLDYFLTKNLNDFIDWDQKECYFTKDAFIQFLSFIKSQTETETSTAFYDKNEVKKRFLNKEFLFYRTVLNDIGTFCNYDNSLGESIEWTGFPLEKGELATRIVATCMIGVNGNSSYKEGAWSFIECMLSSEMQRRKCLGLLENGLSIRKDVLEAQLNKTYISRTDSIYENKKTATKQQVQQMKKLMEAGIYTSIYGSSKEERVLQMIQEEIDAFFNQDKTAEETAGLIQNRIQLFINE